MLTFVLKSCVFSEGIRLDSAEITKYRLSVIPYLHQVKGCLMQLRCLIEVHRSSMLGVSSVLSDDVTWVEN